MRKFGSGTAEISILSAKIEWIFTLLSMTSLPGSGADPGLKKGGGHNTLFFSRTTASLESRASPKKADERGEGLRHFFFLGAPPASRVAQVPNGKGGESDTFLFYLFIYFCFCFFRFQKGWGAHVQKRGGGKCTKRFQKGGHGPGVPPPPPPLNRALGSDVSDHFFWSEYRVNRTRFHLLSSEFSLYRMELESNEIHSSTNEISSLHR